MLPLSPGLARILERLKRLPKWTWMVIFAVVISVAALLAVVEWAGMKTTAATLPAGPVAPGNDAASTVALGLNVLLKLGVVVILIYISLMFVRRWQLGLTGRSSKQVALIETTHLAPKQALHLVRVGDQMLLIGATDDSLTLIADVSESLPPETAAQDTVGAASSSGLAVQESPAPGNFAGLLAKNLFKK